MVLVILNSSSSELSTPSVHFIVSWPSWKKRIKNEQIYLHSLVWGQEADQWPSLGQGLALGHSSLFPNCTVHILHWTVHTSHFTVHTGQCTPCTTLYSPKSVLPCPVCGDTWDMRSGHLGQIETRAMPELHKDLHKARWNLPGKVLHLLLMLTTCYVVNMHFVLLSTELDWKVTMKILQAPCRG